MRIAELEQRTGVSRHTLRYYEKEGLLHQVHRGENNYRDYPEQAIKQVTMLCQMKDLGFSLREIRQISDALKDDALNCQQGAELMAEKREIIEDRIKSLKKMSRMLAREQRRLEESWAKQCGIK